MIKPSEETPLSALAFCEILGDIGSVPAGLVNVVTCSRENTVLAGETLCASPIIRKISFTGSTAVGKVWMTVNISANSYPLGWKKYGFSPEYFLRFGMD